MRRVFLRCSWRVKEGAGCRSFLLGAGHADGGLAKVTVTGAKVKTENLKVPVREREFDGPVYDE